MQKVASPQTDVTDTLIDLAIVFYPFANKVAVQNFCWTAPDDPRANAWNIGQDARLYGWNNDTVDAIAFVLRSVNKL